MKLVEKEALLFIVWKLFAEYGNKGIYRITALKNLLSDEEKNSIPSTEFGKHNFEASEKIKFLRTKIFKILDNLRFVFGCDIKFETDPDFIEEIYRGISSSDYSIERYNCAIDDLNNTNDLNSYFKIFEDNETYEDINFTTKFEDEEAGVASEEKCYQASADRHFLNLCTCSITVDIDKSKDCLNEYLQDFSAELLEDFYLSFNSHKKEFENFLKNNMKNKASTSIINFKMDEIWNYKNGYRFLEYILCLAEQKKFKIIDVQSLNPFSDLAYEIVVAERINEKQAESLLTKDADKIFVSWNKKKSIDSICINGVELCGTGKITGQILDISNLLLKNINSSLKKTRFKDKNGKIKDLDTPISKINSLFRNSAPENHFLKSKAKDERFIVSEDGFKGVEYYRINPEIVNLIISNSSL